MFQKEIRAMCLQRRLSLTLQTLVLLSLDKTSYVSLQRILSLQCIDRVDIDLSDNGLPCLYEQTPPIPPSVDDVFACATKISQMLALVDSLTRLNLYWVWAPVAALFLTACRQIQTAYIHLRRGESPDNAWPVVAASVRGHPRLRTIHLGDVERVTLRTMGPVLRTLPLLTELELTGLDSCVLFSEQDADLVLDLRSLEKLTLNHVDFATEPAADAFCDGISESSIHTLVMHYHVSFPEEKHVDLAKALVDSSLVHLEYFAPVSQAFLDAFSATLVASHTSVMERLRFSHMVESNHSFDFRDMSNVWTRGRNLDRDWVRQVQRTLHLNAQRRLCPPLFSAIGQAATDADQRRLLAEALTSVEGPIIYEYLRSNRCNLIGLVVHFAGSAPHAIVS